MSLKRQTNLELLGQLRDVHLKNWPRHCVGYYCMDNYIKWLQRDPNIKNVEIYTLADDWQDNGFYIVKDGALFNTHWLTKTPDVTIAKALSQVDWSDIFLIPSLIGTNHDDLHTFIKSQEKLILSSDNLTYLYYMPKEKALALEVNCPAEYAIRDLRVEDAATVDSVWPHRYDGSLAFLSKMIERNISTGVFRKDTNELVAWCIRLTGGLLGALQVKENYMRRGLGSVVLKAMSKKIAETGDDIVGGVFPANYASRGMFEKAGFMILDHCYWPIPKQQN